MNKTKTLAIIIVSILCFYATAGNAEQESYWSWLFSLERKKEVAPVRDQVYKDECSECHLDYPTGFLPEASWEKLLSARALEDHFGENAELDEETRVHILSYARANSADKSRYKRSRKVMASLSEGEAPLRITEVLYIKEKHEEIPEKLITSAKVKSLSYCDKCHRKTSDGNYDNDTVYIPGHGYPDY